MAARSTQDEALTTGRPHSEGNMDIIRARALMAVIDDRIHELWSWRTWYRARPFTVDWPSRATNDIELRALVTLARQARDLSRPAVEQRDYITESDRLWNTGPIQMYEGMD